MRGRLAVVVAVVLFPFALAGPAGARSGGADAVSVGATGTLGSDGSVTLSGTYRCGPAAGQVFVSSNLRIGDVRQSTGSTKADCDGREHSWTTIDKPRYLKAAPGPAEAQATLLTLGSGGGLPLPTLLAADRQNITLVTGAG